MSSFAGNPWKLGLFVILGVLALVMTVFWLASQHLNPEVLPAITYFNESVEGIDIGSSIKIRGVKVGVVSNIGIAPDHRMVRVRMKLFVDTLEGLGLWPPPVEQVEIPGRLGPADLRVQLVSVGITGTKFIQADFFDPKENPLPVLSFPPERNYVPSIPSTLKSVGDALEEIVVALPRAVEDVDGLVVTLKNTFEEARVVELAERIEGVLTRTEQLLGQVDGEGISKEIVSLASETRKLVERLTERGGPIDVALASWQSLATELGDSVAAAQVGDTSRSLRDAAAQVGGAATAVRSLGADAGTLTIELEQDLASLRETLEALRALAMLLERDPGALLRGRAPGAEHPLESDR
jgi:ABC-type transporter Mla subunit MlaD